MFRSLIFSAVFILIIIYSTGVHAQNLPFGKKVDVALLNSYYKVIKNFYYTDADIAPDATEVLHMHFEGINHIIQKVLSNEHLNENIHHKLVLDSLNYKEWNITHKSYDGILYAELRDIEKEIHLRQSMINKYKSNPYPNDNGLTNSKRYGLLKGYNQACQEKNAAGIYCEMAIDYPHLIEIKEKELNSLLKQKEKFLESEIEENIMVVKVYLKPEDNIVFFKATDSHGKYDDMGMILGSSETKHYKALYFKDMNVDLNAKKSLYHFSFYNLYANFYNSILDSKDKFRDLDANSMKRKELFNLTEKAYINIQNTEF